MRIGNARGFCDPPGLPGQRKFTIPWQRIPRKSPRNRKNRSSQQSRIVDFLDTDLRLCLGRGTHWSGIMRAWCLLALLAVVTSGCCSTHRAWLDGYSSCVPECGSCECDSGCGLFGHQSCLFKKKSRGCYCHCMTSCDPCGGCGDCFTGCDSSFSNCDSCAGQVMWNGTMDTGCSSCAQGQTFYNGSMPSGGCQHCMQNQMMPAQSSPQNPPQAPAPPIPAVPPAEPAPEPTKAQMMQLQSIPTQPVQYQEMAPPVQYSPPATSYSPPAAQAAPAVQPVLWVPAQSPQAPLLVPPAR